MLLHENELFEDKFLIFINRNIYIPDSITHSHP